MKMAFTINAGTVKAGDNLFKLNRITVTSNMSLDEFEVAVGTE